MHLYSKCINTLDLTPDDSTEVTTQALRNKGNKAQVKLDFQMKPLKVQISEP